MQTASAQPSAASSPGAATRWLHAVILHVVLLLSLYLWKVERIDAAGNLLWFGVSLIFVAMVFLAACWLFAGGCRPTEPIAPRLRGLGSFNAVASTAFIASLVAVGHWGLASMWLFVLFVAAFQRSFYDDAGVPKPKS